MKLTKSQKVYVAVLVTAVVAFLVDRVFLGGDGQVEQASAAEGSVVSAESPRRVSAPPEAPDDTPSIAARLADLQQTHAVDPRHMREAFLPSAAWNRQLRPSRPSQNPSAPQVPASLSARGDAFVAAYQLKSILHLDDGGVALVNEKVVRIGDTLGGFTLIELTEDAAVFESDGHRVRLKLANPAG